MFDSVSGVKAPLTSRLFARPPGKFVIMESLTDEANGTSLRLDANGGVSFVLESFGDINSLPHRGPFFDRLVHVLALHGFSSRILKSST